MGYDGPEGATALASAKEGPLSTRSYPVLSALAAAFLLLASCATTQATRQAAEWYDLGNGWYDQGEWAKAGAAYSKAIALDPSLAAASYNLARALAESGDYDGALSALSSVLASDPDNVRALGARAWVRYKSGDPKAALADYRRVLELEPGAPEALVNASILELASGNLEAVLANLATYVEVRPEDGKALLVYARALSGLGRNEEALAAYDRLPEGVKLETVDRESRAKMYEATREYAKAIDEYSDLVAANPRDTASLFALARLRLSEAEDPEGGLDALAKALEAGFEDKEAARALLAEPGLVSREEVAKALKAKGLVE